MIEVVGRTTEIEREEGRGRRASPIIFAGPANQGRRPRRPDDMFHRALEKLPVFNYVERVAASGTPGPGVYRETENK